MNKLNILIVGAGSIGARHIKNLLGLGYENITIADTNKDLLKSFSGKFSFYMNYAVALKKEKPDVVFICTPTMKHIGQASLALKYGCHVFVEKPLSYKLRGIDKLKREASGKTVMVGCNWRFNSAYLSFEKIIKSKKFGEVQYVRVACGAYLPYARPDRDYKKVYAAKKQGGGVLLDSGSHVVGYLTALFGPVEFSYHIKNSKNPLGIESDQVAHVILVHKNKVTCDISLDFISTKLINRVEAVTNLGILTLDLYNNFVKFDNATSNKMIFKNKPDQNEMYVLELKHFFKCIFYGTKPLQDISDAEDILRVILVGGKN